MSKSFPCLILCALCFLVHGGTEPLAIARGYNSSDLAQRRIQQSPFAIQPARNRERFRNHAQKKRPAKQTPKPAAPLPEDDLSKLRDSYVQATKEYKASLQKLLALYEASEQKAEQRLSQSKDLYAAGLLAKNKVDEGERAVTVEKEKVSGVEHQIASADTQIADVLLEVEGEKQLAKLGPMKKGGLIRTTSFIRYSGTGSWLLSQAGKIEAFFQQTFKRPLPIAVFGQGAIHDRWRLDHRNAMDISLNPDGPEGQALMNFLQSNGIPFSAFRGAIPGVATGPHIHIGMPSHRY